MIKNQNISFQVFLIFIICIVLSNSLFSQSTPWTSNGPYIEIRSEATGIYHSDPNIILSGDNGVIYKSTNAGETWRYLCSYEGVINCIVMDPFQDSIIYLGNSNLTGIFKSVDNGKTWTKIGLDGAYVKTIVIDKNNTEIIFAGVGDWGSSSSGEVTGIFKTSDGGINWEHIYSEDIDCVNKIIIDSDNNSTIYASISSSLLDIDFKGGFLKSEDSGQTWRRRNVSGDTWDESWNVVQAKTSTNDLFCVSKHSGYSKGLYRSSDKGDSWESVNPGGSFAKFVIDPINSNILYAFGGETGDWGLYKSTNRGDSWTLVNNEFTGSTGFFINPIDGRLTNIYKGIYQSQSGGTSWEDCPVFSNITDIAVHPYDDDTLYAAIAGDYLCKSTDASFTWSPRTTTSRNDNIVEMCSTNPKRIIVASGQYYHYSSNGGVSFSNTYIKFQDGTDSYPEEIRFAPKSEDTMIVCTSGSDGVISISKDKGNSWKYIYFNGTSFVFDPIISSTIYAGQKEDGGIFRISEVWSDSLHLEDISPLFGIGNVNDIAIDDESCLYVATSEGFWSWNGSNWNKFEGLPSDNITAVVLDTNETPKIIYVGTENNGVFVSLDEGDSWSKYGEGLDSLSITKLAISETNSSRLYAGTEKGGLWVTDLLVGFREEQNEIATNFVLNQNYPNPFNPITTIKYSVPKQSNIKIQVTDILGRKVVTLVNEEQMQGNYMVEFCGNELTSGIYFYTIKAGKFIETKKMILLK